MISVIIPTLLLVPSMFQIFWGSPSFCVPSLKYFTVLGSMKLLVAPESTSRILLALLYAVQNETGTFILRFLVRYTVYIQAYKLLFPRLMGSSLGKSCMNTSSMTFSFSPSSMFRTRSITSLVDGGQGFGCTGFYSTSRFLLFLQGFICFPCSDLSSVLLIRAFSTLVSNVFAIETLPLLHKMASFVFSQGSPGTGTSSRSVRGIWIFGKTLLPLLFEGSSRGVVFVVAAGTAKIHLELEEFAMVSDGSFDPVTEFLVLIHWFHLHHCFLESQG